MSAFRLLTSVALLQLLSAHQIDLDQLLGGSGHQNGGGDAAAVQEQLSNVLAAGNALLKEAEHQHAKALKKVRRSSATDMTAQATKLGSSVASYSEDLTKAETKFNTTLNEIRLELTKVDAGTSVSAKAVVNAQLGSAKRHLKHNLRMHASLVQQAQTKAEESLENEADTLTAMWLGDMSQPLGEAKDVLEAAAANSITAQVADVVKSGSKQQRSTTARMEAKLADAEKTVKADVEAALKKFSDVVDEDNKHSAVFVAGVKKTMAAADKKAEEHVKLKT